MPIPNYGKRQDGTDKGLGFFGELKRPDGDVSTELSIGVNLGGKETEIPLIVPTLDKVELDYLLSGGKATPAIIQKSVNHALSRLQSKQSPFAEEGEQVTPPTDDQAFDQGFSGQ